MDSCHWVSDGVDVHNSDKKRGSHDHLAASVPPNCSTRSMPDELVDTVAETSRKKRVPVQVQVQVNQENPSSLQRFSEDGKDFVTSPLCKRVCIWGRPREELVGLQYEHCHIDELQNNNGFSLPQQHCDPLASSLLDNRRDLSEVCKRHMIETPELEETLIREFIGSFLRQLEKQRTKCDDLK